MRAQRVLLILQACVSLFVLMLAGAASGAEGAAQGQDALIFMPLVFFGGPISFVSFLLMGRSNRALAQGEKLSKEYRNMAWTTMLLPPAMVIVAPLLAILSG